MARGSSRKKNLKDILLDNKLLTEEQLNDAMAEATKTDQPLQQIVINNKLIDKLELLQILSSEWSVRAIDLSEIEVDPDVVKIIPENSARRHLAMPFAKEESVLFVAMANPRDFFVSEDIHLRTGYEVQSYLSLPDDISKALDKVYGAKEGEALQKVMEQIGKEQGDNVEIKEAQSEEKMDISEVDVSAPEVEKIVNAIILGGLQKKCSDIHIEPFETKIIVRYRIDGNLTESKFEPPFAYRFALIAKIKIMTQQMDITERRKPQDGRIQILSAGKPMEFRVNIIPTVYGESCVMRVLDRESVKVSMDKMGFLPDTLEKFKASLNKPFGLILVCGPTGSGKSTTLYSALNFINSPDTKIVTAENPVEYNLDGIIQLNVNQEIGLDFSTALRAFLRQDPDVIMVGEIRDKETATIALEAAMTGHLVFSTVHTNDAAGAVARLHEMGVPTFLISSTIECVLAQRLIRRICAECGEDIEQTQEIIDYLGAYGIDTNNMKLRRGKGCTTCNQTGYKGRLGIHELLTLDDELRAFFLKEIASGPITELAKTRGMRTMLIDGLTKVSLGHTTIEEVLSATQ